MNIVAEVMKLVHKDQDEQIFRATVVTVTGNTIKFERTGWIADNQFYPILEGTSVSVGGEVLVARVGAGYVILGEVLR